VRLYVGDGGAPEIRTAVTLSARRHSQGLTRGVRAVQNQDDQLCGGTRVPARVGVRWIISFGGGALGVAPRGRACSLALGAGSSWARLGWVLSVGRPLGASGGGSACGVWKEQFRHLHQGDRAQVVSC